MPAQLQLVHKFVNIKKYEKKDIYDHPRDARQWRLIKSLRDQRLLLNCFIFLPINLSLDTFRSRARIS